VFEIIKVNAVNKLIKSVLLIVAILLLRKSFNRNSIKYANKIMWSLLFVYLINPFGLQINIENASYGPILDACFSFIKQLNEYTELLLIKFSNVLYLKKRLIAAILFLIYLIFTAIETNKALRSANKVNNLDINEYISSFNLKRRVDVLINDKLETPVSYGFFKPKIILQTYILKDDIMLKNVIYHEMMHIKKCDILLNYFKYMLACFYWYNLFVLLALKYIDEDLEILCDKLVINKMGGSNLVKRDYLETMFKLSTVENKNVNKFVSELNPTLERMRIMSSYRITKLGVLSLALVFILSLNSFAYFNVEPDDKVVSSVKALDEGSKLLSDRVEVIDKDEYEEINKMSDNLIALRKIDIKDYDILDGLESRTYKFNMFSSDTTYHNGFTIKLSEMSCSSGLNYEIMIQENERVIYDETFDKETILKVKANQDNEYKVVIMNKQGKKLKYNIQINSYVR
jgi:beta-lactamase regulating signal transducer with metallopeptidase domain